MITVDDKRLEHITFDRNGLCGLFDSILEEEIESMTLEIDDLSIEDLERVTLVASEFCYDLMDMYTEEQITYITYEYCS